MGCPDSYLDPPASFLRLPALKGRYLFACPAERRSDGDEQKGTICLIENNSRLHKN